MKTKNPLIRLLLSDWQWRLTAAITGIFLLQFVSWIAEEDYVWLPETVLYVKVSLLIVFILEVLLYRTGALRFPLQAIAVILYTASVVDYPPITADASFIEKLSHFFVQLHPFVWFTSGAWLVYVVAIYWVQARWRIYVLMFISIIAMAVRDSFSHVYLWQQVAIVVLCGLSLIVIRHFTDMKHRNPIGWSYLADYPATVAIPVVLLLSIVVIPSLFAPNITNLLTDPYTLWKNWKGEPVSFSGKGLNPFQNELDSSSGYSRNDHDLGGGFNFDYNPVMAVNTTHRSYWRGESRTIYTGSGWEQSASEKQGPTSAVQPAKVLRGYSGFNDSLSSSMEVKQTVTMLTDDSYPVLFGAYSIGQVEEAADDRSFERLQWMGRSSELRWMERSSLPYPRNYTLTSQVTIINEDELRKVRRIPSGTMDEYLQLPDTVTDRVRTMAAEITKDAETPYDQVKAIEQYLQTNFKYTNNPNSNGSDQMDFVDRFLFEVQEGYCDYFSTAMAVMTRSIGMPTRWVKGFAPGSLANDGLTELFSYEEADPDGAGTYTIRNSDAHSWVEVYFEGFGWIPFEPTSGFALPSFQQPAENIQPPELDLTPEQTPEEQEELKVEEETGQRSNIITISVLGIILLLAIAGIGMTRWGRDRVRLIVSKEIPASGMRQQVVAEYNRLIRYARRKGKQAHEYETARETMLRWADQHIWARSDMLRLLDLFEKAKYSQAPISREECDQVVSIVKKLKENL
ncbi:transglutaminase domain-containing protein [Paenibacillus sp. J2TS4]|uniref:DUF4129 domain-containing transglutaminase family protein n=1 Tax=Paenibacillus sp. J2TS4 TaxID=2807194 RepID=UPI001B1261B7|nr:transglutaminase domain-containing protein [Paenibacillus sp. J2TS4]GIP35895.1 hypothetical protein J2TS4_51050 [Paenibacillus sp. J2TS4]